MPLLFIGSMARPLACIFVLSILALISGTPFSGVRRQGKPTGRKKQTQKQPLDAAEVYLDIFPGMWHGFHQYIEGAKGRPSSRVWRLFGT